jgi:hypothetical protein
MTYDEGTRPFIKPTGRPDWWNEPEFWESPAKLTQEGIVDPWWKDETLNSPGRKEETRREPEDAWWKEPEFWLIGTNREALKVDEWWKDPELLHGYRKPVDAWWEQGLDDDATRGEDAWWKDTSINV